MKIIATAAVLGSALALAGSMSTPPTSNSPDGVSKTTSQHQTAENIANENPALISRLAKAGGGQLVQDLRVDEVLIARR